MTGMRTDASRLVHGMDEKALVEDDQQDVPVLVTLGDENVPVCEDGSCAL
jgi:hypothetical protein